ncbi:MAG: carbohydrate kinase family protein [Nocardiopsaceae bacterium]|nr:carbohydrate kinase family protein [Nocardiopsaceae bacterium]
MTGFDLVVVGDCNADLLVSGGDVVPSFGQAERLVDDATLTIGGSGGIVAAGAARLGLRVAMAGVVGDDVFGRFMRDSLGARGVDMSAVRTDPRIPTGLSINLIRDDDRAILTSPGTILQSRAEDIDPDLLASARHVHVSSYFLQTGLWPGLPGLLRRARVGGATTSLDPNWDPSETWDQGLSGVYGLLDVLFPNGAEAAGLARALLSAAARGGPAISGDPADRGETPADGTPGSMTPEDAARVLAGAGPAVVVKLGAEGALAALPGGEILRVPAPGDVNVVDSVGAGDSFDAGYLAATLWGWDPRRALALGAACGALSTRLPGGTAAQPTRDEAVATASTCHG